MCSSFRRHTGEGREVYQRLCVYLIIVAFNIHSNSLTHLFKGYHGRAGGNITIKNDDSIFFLIFYFKLIFEVYLIWDLLGHYFGTDDSLSSLVTYKYSINIYEILGETRYQ